ncbi:MAG: hypothetical protein AAF667_19445 [Pseudomonadota bacterium]
MPQLIVAVSIPLVTLLYDPTVLGTFLIFDAYCDIFAFGATLALDKALYVTRSPRGSRDLIRATLISITLVSLLAGGFFGAGIWMEITTEGLTQPWLIVPVVLLVWARGAYYLFQSLSIRASRFGAVVVAESTRAAALVIGRIVLGLLGYGLAGLVVTSIAGAWISVSALIQGARIEGRLQWRTVTVATYRRSVARHRERILFEGGGQFLRQLPIRGPVFAITIYFAAAGAGLYSIAFLLCYRPAELIVRSVTEVFRTSMAESIRADQYEVARVLGEDLLRRTILSAAGASVLMGGAIFLAEDILFSAEWSGVGSVALANAIYVAGLLMLRPIQIIYSLYGRDRLSLLLEGGAVVACFGGIFLGGAMGVSLEIVCVLSGLVMVFVAVPLALAALRVLRMACA